MERTYKEMQVQDLKALGDSGEFSGYASIFGNVDLGGDVVQQGAFKEIVTTKDGFVRVLYQHDTRRPIGKARVTEDVRGLAFDGRLVLSDAVARSAYEMMKAGIIDGMSIGFDVLPNGSEMRQDGVRLLKSLKLYEISPVVFGMNQLAGITAVKYSQQIVDIRGYENFLREVGGFSRAQAKLLASSWKLLPGQRDAGDGEPTATEVQQLVTDILSAARKLSPTS